jgi:P27 family predicted phage terminase small subunit
VKRKTVKAPEHLSLEARDLWSQLQKQYGITDTAGLLLLTTALESWDRLAMARRQLETEGLVITDRFGAARQNPLVAIERDSRSIMLRAFKALRLDIPEPVR